MAPVSVGDVVHPADNGYLVVVRYARQRLVERFSFRMYEDVTDTVYQALQHGAVSVVVTRS